MFAFAIPKIADYGEVWTVVKGLSWQWIALLVGALCLDIGTYAPPWMAALPGLSYLHGTRVTLASTSLSAVAPGGGAAGITASFAMLKGWGFRGRPVGLAVAVTAVWSQLVILGVPILALAALVAQGGRSRTLELVAMIALALFAVIVIGCLDWPHELPTRTPRWRLRGPHSELAQSPVSASAPVKWNGDVFVRFRTEANELIRRRWHFLTFATLANHLTVFIVLVASLRAVNIPQTHITLVEAFAAWALARVLGSIPITPGGIGFVELGLTGALVGFGVSCFTKVAGFRARLAWGSGRV